MERTIADAIIFLGGLRQFCTNHKNSEGSCFEKSRTITVVVVVVVDSS